MRFYNAQHQYYCGGDLHARTLFLHILDAGGKTVFEKNLPASPQAFLDAVTPYREGLVVGVECMFAWYWLMSPTRSRFRADVPAKIFATHSSLPSCLAGPAERRGFWDARRAGGVSPGVVRAGFTCESGCGC
jgi:hypothetical protein